MSLDIALLGPDGSPKKKVSIRIDDHHQLMQLIGNKGGLLGRLNDYYADAEFAHSEIQSLVSETEALIERCHVDRGLSLILVNLVELGKVANSEGRGLIAIAD